MTQIPISDGVSEKEKEKERGREEGDRKKEAQTDRGDSGERYRDRQAERDVSSNLSNDPDQYTKSSGIVFKLSHPNPKICFEQFFKVHALKDCVQSYHKHISCAQGSCRILQL